jgi:hypothetical protein
MASLYDEIDSSDDEHIVVPKRNLISAAQFIQSIFEINGVDSAVLGGLAFLILGHSRDTFDVDICVQGKFRQIRQIVEHFDRYPLHTYYSIQHYFSLIF